MKKVWLLMLIWGFSSAAFTQELDAEETPAPSPRSVRRVTNWTVGASLTHWNEELRLTQGGVTVGSTANFSGMLVSAHKEFTYYRWGWNVAGLVGSGYANGGGDGGTPNYLKSRLTYSLFGGSSRFFYRLSGRQNVGMSLMLFNRIIEWPTESGVSAESGRNPNIVVMADFNIRLFQSWELYQGIGPIGNGATLWRVGLNYRF